MATLLVYPLTLPTPQLLPIRSDERRLRAVGRPWSVRTVQRQWVATVDVVFPPMTLERATTLRDWWRDDLYKGGNKFSATWPLPFGQVRATYRFLTPLRFENIQARLGYWQVSAQAEVTLSEAPVLFSQALFLLHFDGNLTDSAQGHLFESDTIITDAAPNSFTYTSSSPLFSQAQVGRFPGTNNHIRSDPYPDLQLADADFQFEGFFRPRDTSGDIGGPLICTGSLQTPDGNTVGPDPQSGQFALSCDEDGEYLCEYATAIGSDDLVVVGTPDPAVLDDWNYFRFISTAAGMFLFAAPASEEFAPVVAQALGLRPYAGAYDALQRFFIGCRYTGGAPPLETYVERYHGDVQDFRGMIGLTEPLVGGEAVVPTSSLRAEI